MSHKYFTVSDYQTRAKIEILEGERTMSKDNNLLGVFTLSNIQRAPAGKSSFNLTFEIDADGILHATAVDKSTGSANGITITGNKGRLSQDEIDRLVREAEARKEEDEMRKKAAEAKNQLERYCYDTKKRAQSAQNVDSMSRKKIVDKCDETLLWAESNPNATEDDYERKKRELELTVELISLKL